MADFRVGHCLLRSDSAAALKVSPIHHRIMLRCLDKSCDLQAVAHVHVMDVLAAGLTADLLSCPPRCLLCCTSSFPWLICSYNAWMGQHPW